MATGVRHFFDLTQDGELPDYRELLPAQVAYHSFPIPDHSLPETTEVMRAILDALAARTQAGEAVYVHCRAGIGRTGTVVGCFLRERGASGDAALEELNRLWLQNARSETWPSIPETAEQYNFVRHWQPAAPAPAPERPRPPDRAPSLERFRGCLLGLATGDARVNGGGWSDETGMTLCVAESLLAHWGFDARDQLLRYGIWAQDPVAQGAAIGVALRPPVVAALTRSLRSHAPVGGSHDPRLVDPSPLVRTAAAAMFSARNPPRAMALAADVARVTHQAPQVVDACRLFAGLLTALLTGGDKAAMLEAAGARLVLPLHADVAAMAKLWSAPPGGRRPRLPGILGALDSAVRAFLRTDGFEAGLARLGESGPDPDATLSAFGALAGAHYGEAALASAAGPAGDPASRERLGALAEQLFRAASAR